MNDRKTNPYLFVVGCPRSGTTLLQRMLDHHPKLAVANDTHFIPRALQRAAPHHENDAVKGRPIPLEPALIETLITYHRFHRIGLTSDEARRLAATSRDYSDWIGRIYSCFAERSVKPLAGEKTPDYVRHLPLLHGLFPKARSLHIIRDGRDVALSTLQWAGPKKGPGRWPLWERDPVGACALWWRYQVETGRRDARSLPTGSHQEVLYERLVAEPEAGLRRIAAFLDLPYDDSMVLFHQGKTTANPRKSAKGNWLPPTKGLRDWRSQMVPEDVAVFEAIAGNTLVATGFERTASDHLSPSVQGRVDTCLDWWAAFDGRRRRKARRRMEVAR